MNELQTAMLLILNFVLFRIVGRMRLGGESLSYSLGAFFRISWRDPSAASQVRLCGMTVLGRCDRIQSWHFSSSPVITNTFCGPIWTT